ncbi:alpha/beta fold hydrolase [Geodermatophilus sp. SYSU D00525]
MGEHASVTAEHDDAPPAPVSPADDTLRLLRTGAGPVSCADGGSGTPVVVFVGGAGGPAVTWEPVRARVAGTTRALAFDRPGYGESPRRRGGPLTSPRRLAAELSDVLAAAGTPTPVVLVAHSFGGFVARAFAAAHPEAVAGLVLVDATHEEEWTDRYPEAHRRGLALAPAPSVPSPRPRPWVCRSCWPGCRSCRWGAWTGCRSRTARGRAGWGPAAAACAPPLRSSPAWRRPPGRWPTWAVSATCRSSSSRTAGPGPWRPGCPRRRPRRSSGRRRTPSARSPHCPPAAGSSSPTPGTTSTWTPRRSSSARCSTCWTSCGGEGAAYRPSRLAMTSFMISVVPPPMPRMRASR